MADTYKNGDIKLAISFKNNGVVTPVDSVPFNLVVWARYHSRATECSFDGVTFTNCFMRDERLIITLDEPKWKGGTVYGKLFLYYPDAEMPDGVFTKVIDLVFDDAEQSNVDISASTTINTDIVGVAGKSAYQSAVDNGFVGRVDEWLLSLKQPAIDAANALLSLKTSLEEANIVANEQEVVRGNRETARVTAENARVTKETARIQNETTRSASENTRGQNETARQLAETNRANAENTRVQVRKDIDEAETLRVNQENTRKTAESGRNTAESERVEAEIIREAAAKEVDDKIKAKANTADVYSRTAMDDKLKDYATTTSVNESLTGIDTILASINSEVL